MSATVHIGEGEVLLVRHAETEWSRDGRHTGRSDIPLTDSGRQTAASLADQLGKLIVRTVLVSPLTRARETFELSGLGGEAQLRDDLMEWDYGDYEGLTSAEIRQQRADWDLWRDGCPGGESPRQVGERADRIIAELRAIDGPAAVFSHGHMLRVLGARWIELEPLAGGRLGLSTAAMCVLSHEHGRQTVDRWNYTREW